MPEGEAFACSLGDYACEVVEGVPDIELEFVSRLNRVHSGS